MHYLYGEIINRRVSRADCLPPFDVSFSIVTSTSFIPHSLHLIFNNRIGLLLCSSGGLSFAIPMSCAPCTDTH